FTIRQPHSSTLFPYTTLFRSIPNATREAMQSSEIGILRRAIKNRGRGISIRRLFDQIPTLLPRIAPCMLMSPISAAQYFDVNTEDRKSTRLNSSHVKISYAVF